MKRQTMSEMTIIILSFVIALLLGGVAAFRGWTWRPAAIVLAGMAVYAILVYVLTLIPYPSIYDNLSSAMSGIYPDKPVLLIIVYLLMDMVFPVTALALFVMAIVGHKPRAI
jgi:hypothetical protein